MLLNSKHHPWPSQDSGDQCSPPCHWPASVASNLIRGEERKREMRLGGTGAQKADRCNLKENEPTIVQTCWNCKQFWTCQDQMFWKNFAIKDNDRGPCLVYLSVTKVSISMIISLHLLSPGQTVWLSKASPHQMVEQHGGKTNIVHLKHVADHQNIFYLKLIFLFVLVRMNEWIWQDWS